MQPTDDELAWLVKLSEVGRAYPAAGDESAAAHDCKRKGWSVLALQSRRRGDERILSWPEVFKICPDALDRSAEWFPVGEQLTEAGWMIVAEFGQEA